MKGFTLVEIMVSIALLTIVIMSIFAAFTAGDIMWNVELVYTELQQQTRLAMDGMTREIRQSGKSAVDISEGVKILFYLHGVPSPIIYYLNNNNQIIREHPKDTTKILANNVTALSFSRTGDVVEVQINAAKTDKKGRDLQFSLTEKVRLRNE